MTALQITGLAHGLIRASDHMVLVLSVGYKSVAHYLVLTKLATAAEEGAVAAVANAAAAAADDACTEQPSSTAPVTRQRKSSPARPGPLATSHDFTLAQRLVPQHMHASLCRCANPDAVALYAGLPAAAAAPVADAQPVQSPQEEGNAAGDVPAQTDTEGPAKRGRTKEAASPGVPARQERIDTILSKAKRPTGTAKSLAGKAFTKLAALAGAQPSCIMALDFDVTCHCTQGDTQC